MKSINGPKFTVYIDYTTGDSSKTERIENEEIGFVWANYEKALQAARLVRNHDDLLNRYNGTFGGSAKDRENAWNESLKSEWYMNYKNLRPNHKIKNNFDLFNSFAVTDDNGDPIIIAPFWYGFFETLNGITVGVIHESIKERFEK